MTNNLELLNTESRKLEPLKTLEPGIVKMYCCGPTVYDFAHIGNFRTYVFEDLLKRSMKHFGYTVTHVMNITDVDDKTIRGATKNNVTLNEYVAPFLEAFYEDVDTLNIIRADHYPKATDFIAEMIEFIEKLIEKGVAYQGKDGSVYYDIAKFPRYGCLSHLKLDELKRGASERTDSDEYDKENASDFVLWKGYDAKRDGSIYWDSPFGKGRPGWHLECSTMAMQILGETLDVHVGGVDNMFPHHENEIAQSEAYSGKRFVGHWLHSEHLLVDNKKMSKSLGNFYTLRDLLEKGFSGKEVRYMLLHTHYKTQLNFTLEGLECARHSLKRLNAFICRLKCLPDDANGTHPNLDTYIETAKENFNKALANDLNISVALASLFDFVRDVNSALDTDNFSNLQADKVLDLLKEFDAVLGVMDFEQFVCIPKEILDALEGRNLARKEKNWAEADRLRDFIDESGYVIEDSPAGSKVKKK